MQMKISFPGLIFAQYKSINYYYSKKYLKDGRSNGLVLVVYSHSVDGVGFLKIILVERPARITSRKLRHQT